MSCSSQLQHKNMAVKHIVCADKIASNTLNVIFMNQFSSIIVRQMLLQQSMTQQQILPITENLIAYFLVLMQIERQRINTTVSSENRYSVQNCYQFSSCRISVKVLSVIAGTKFARW
ncbi:Hypothetical_protein [Hexamita inflata]|uniref:Hypothetical_protein n=1 Tax=Hexamita inflata TaxID=28002 RepID=A0AA86RD14_9EUKA|nr:Hypothetical protein HINF_LOCUS58519 [Hexamita inflata]CAI9970877.1 Hypothetical protein HINF_LOCUS58522 [Hexamita inflata]CAI9970881.1 Hypothetical protein HINF_LOCUS58526 [Hexamita inflata]CAI9970885.1 Hypothetical protein HINF_LOCUS58530 [Hexamita inflata]CAI9970889.1 Hypothetical protein HINF_LOCUS58534 [Hexamita inflata]